MFRRGFLGKVRRTSVVEHYGIRTLLYGTLLPGPRIDVHAGAQMRAVRDAGFEVGVHCHDHVRWQDGVAIADAAWTRREFVRALEAFERVFGTPARSHAAAGWQINAGVLELEHEFSLAYASDSRGSEPFWPLMAGVAGQCIQMPTTLPTLDEMIGLDGRDAQAAAEEILRRSLGGATGTHVFTLHAELEGQKLLPQFEFLLRRWREAGIALTSMQDLPPGIARHCGRPQRAALGRSRGALRNARGAGDRAVTPVAQTELSRNLRRALWALLAVFIAVWLISLGARGLYDPDEGALRGNSARDARQRRLGDSAARRPGVHRKAAAAVLGRRDQSGHIRQQRVAARLYNGLCALGTLYLTWMLVRREWGTAAAVRAALMLASTLMFVLMGQQLLLDMSLTLYTTLTFASFCLAQRAARWRGWMLLCWAGISGAFLTKG